jgi:hypothetical protein
MPVQAGSQSLLIQEVCNKTDTASKDEQTVQDAHAQVVFCFFGREGTAVAEQIYETDSNTAVNVENQVVFLRCCDGFDGDGVFKEFVGGEVLEYEVFDEFNTEVGVGT